MQLNMFYFLHRQLRKQEKKIMTNDYDLVTLEVEKTILPTEFNGLRNEDIKPFLGHYIMTADITPCCRIWVILYF